MKKINVVLLFLVVAGFTSIALASDERVVRCTILTSYFSEIQNIKDLSATTKTKMDDAYKSLSKDNKCDSLVDMIKQESDNVRKEISGKVSQVLK